MQDLVKCSVVLETPNKCVRLLNDSVIILMEADVCVFKQMACFQQHAGKLLAASKLKKSLYIENGFRILQ